MNPLEDLDPMPFGAHSGVPMQDVPVGYLHWIWHEKGMTSEKAKLVKDYIRRNLVALKQEDDDLIWS